MLSCSNQTEQRLNAVGLANNSTRIGQCKLWFCRVSSIWLLAFTVMVVLLCASRSAAAQSQVQYLEGFSKPNRISNVAANTQGIVAELVASEGAFVKEGQCLVRLDDDAQQLQLRIAKLGTETVGELEAARAELTSTTRRVEIIRELARQGSATPEELLRIETEYALAIANVKTMEEKRALRVAEYEKLKAETAKYCIVAPFDGVLVEYQKSKGEYVGPVEPNVCVIAELTTLSVDFLVPRRFYESLELGQALDVHFVDSNREKTGRVYYISPYPNGETNTFTVKVRIENRDRSLNAGERCQIELAAQHRSEIARKQRSRAGQRMISTAPAATASPQDRVE